LWSVLPIMGMSAAVALPAQFEQYRLITGSSWSAVAIAAMVEGGTWTGAALESTAVAAGRPAGAYRALAWSLAGVAAGMNVAHGVAAGSPQLAVTFGLASLMGPIAWTAYQRLHGQEVAGRTGEEIRLAAIRRLRYPVLSWRAVSLRAARGITLSPEDAWTQVWAARSERRARLRSPATRSSRSIEADRVEVTPIGSGAIEVGAPDPIGAQSIGSIGLPAIGSRSIESGPIESDRVEAQPIESDPIESVVAESDRIESDRVGSSRVRSKSIRSARSGSIESGRSDRSDRVGALGAGRSVSVEVLRARLVDLITAGQLPTAPSAEAIRKALAIGPARARQLRDEVGSIGLPAIGSGPIESDPIEVPQVTETRSIEVDPIESDPIDPIDVPTIEVDPIEVADPGPIDRIESIEVAGSDPIDSVEVGPVVLVVAQ
jgi:hypothetical protein